ncbi:hypothetical protein ACLIMP_06375 [Novosphingobium aerophilum]|uniref:hypothetical protein n=1 Tax=Novosphingobium TaxID=165696 RepID=UPI0006C87A73|nr:MULTISPECIES: hypothetical protein [unclassified Novosphingobium]KPH60228.1 hypothetical protein ADT71_20705 [Novosphingobium sp. ST904]MPS68509.1 hypothetical protein [Novosphingobium sp.]TCM36898.1 hypothetical protein EDF59_113132 [Novosphingobium sp. ST904]WRT93848.1 hypothetical protein U9J33_04855 [Novosphingobium sp. RL4]
MRFDSNKAWSQASLAVSANREVVLALAGVFFLLPQLVFAIFFPQPEMGSGLSETQVVEAVRAYWNSVLPVMIPVALLQALGTLSLLCLLDTDRRPTVGEAIRSGLKGLLPYLLAQIVAGLALAMVAMVVGGVLGVAGGKAGAAIGLGLALILAIAIGVRLSVTAPVVAVEKTLNPIAALARSWALTKGNTGRLLGFYALLMLAMMVLMIFANVLTLPIALLAPAEVARVAGAVLESILATIMALYFVAVIGQVHRQLAGPSPERIAGTFE